jgi:hypothetical protein
LMKLNNLRQIAIWGHTKLYRFLAWLTLSRLTP